MRLVRPLLVVLCFTLLAPIEVSAAEGRVALVIGNAGYEEVPLRNSVNDSRAIAAALRQLNFEVIEVEDSSNKAMQMAVMIFARKLGPDVTSLFYYAGHGVQFDFIHRGIGFDDILVAVSGGDAGAHSSFIRSWRQGRGSTMQSKPIGICLDRH